MNVIKIYLATCDKTSYILPTTIYLYKKFITNMIPHFIILGFSKPILSDWTNVSFVSLSQEPQNVNMWSCYLFHYFKTIPDEFVFFALDDFFPIDYMNTDVYEFVCDYMKSNNVGMCVVDQQPCGCKIRDELHEVIVNNDNMFIYKRKKPVNYQLVLQPCLWNIKYLLTMLEPPNTPWSFELQQSILANMDDGYFNISTSKDNSYKRCIMCYSTQSSLSSKWNGISILGLKHEYVVELIQQGLLPENNLLIGAWDNYIMFNKNRELSKQEFQSLCVNGYESWEELYSHFYQHTITFL